MMVDGADGQPDEDFIECMTAPLMGVEWRKIAPPLPAQHVLVLRDAFAGFQERFGANAEELFEGVGPRNSSSCLKQGRQFVPAPPPQPS